MATSNCTTKKQNGNDDLFSVLREQVIPALRWDQIYDSECHKFSTRDLTREQGFCPWHSDQKSGSSFTVHPTEKVWFCAGCAFGGDAVTYTHSVLVGRPEKPKGSEVLTAAKILFNRAGIPLPERTYSEKEMSDVSLWSHRQREIDITLAVSRERLWSDEGVAVLTYLQGRGLSDDFIRSRGYGCWPTLPELFLRMRREGVEMSPAFRHADFKDHAVVPWPGPFGEHQTIYLAYTKQRVPGTPAHKRCLANLKDAGGNSIINGKSTPLFFDAALSSDLHRDLVTVEGLFDVSVPQDRGMHNVIACVGANFSGLQIESMVTQGVRSVTVQLDPDGAGIKGTANSVVKLEAAGISAYVAPLCPLNPDDAPVYFVPGLRRDATAEQKAERKEYMESQYCDPDTFILQHGIEKWKLVLRRNIPGFLYLCHVALHGFDPATASDIERDAAVRECIDIAGMTSDQLIIGKIAAYVAGVTGESATTVSAAMCTMPERTHQLALPEAVGATNTEFSVGDHVRIHDGYESGGNEGDISAINGTSAKVKFPTGFSKTFKTSTLESLSSVANGYGLEEAPVAPSEEDPTSQVTHPGHMTPDLFDCPGVVASYFQSLQDTAGKPQDDLNFASALAFYSNIVGRRFADEHRGNRTGLYIVGLANSGTGKNHGISMGKKNVHGHPSSTQSVR